MITAEQVVLDQELERDGGSGGWTCDEGETKGGRIQPANRLDVGLEGIDLRFPAADQGNEVLIHRRVPDDIDQDFARGLRPSRGNKFGVRP